MKNQRDGIADPGEGEWIDAATASSLLGVKRATLYAYASRGALRSRPIAGRRERLYAREDVLRLAARSAARAGHGAVAAGALRFGEPVLDTAVSGIDPERGPLYRGVPAIELAARGEPFEAVAALLWGTATAPLDGGAPGRLPRPLPRARPLERLAMALPSMALDDPARFVTSEEAELPRARRVIARCIAALAEDADRARAATVEPTAARGLAVALGARPSAAAAAAVDRALVISADHELNVSTFAARVVASSGADLYACLTAALAALSGPAHGGMTDRVEAFLAELARPEDAARVVRERLARGDPLVGFGHPLYPGGDPRAAFLLEHAERVAPRAPTVRKAIALSDAVRLAGAGEPTLDYGLVATAAAARLPPGSAVALFAIGRMAGWVAHVREQRALGQLLRPRARYVGGRRHA